MGGEGEQTSSQRDAGKVTPEIAAEAAVWIARLHGPDRSSQMEQEFRDWQACSAMHRLAFERCTDVWQEVAGVRLADAYASAGASASSRSQSATSRSGTAGGPGRSKRSRGVLAMVFALLIAAVGLSVHRWGDDGDVYATKVGEQQLVVLDDGTRMTLNTDTRVRVAMQPRRRWVNVLNGEALFEVAKDASRPFVVHAADSEVVALGTLFAVQLTGGGAHLAGALAITLIEGQVSVRPASSDVLHGIAPAQPVLMQAGERIRLIRAEGASNGPVTQHIDRPRIEQTLAWRRHETIFEDVSLLDAVTEMNRYDRTPIVLVGGASLAQLRVSGQYRTGDSASFAKAVAQLHGLIVHERQGRLELASPPRTSPG